VDTCNSTNYGGPHYAGNCKRGFFNATRVQTLADDSDPSAGESFVSLCQLTLDHYVYIYVIASSISTKKYIPIHIFNRESTL